MWVPTQIYWLEEMIILQNWNMVVGLVALQHLILIDVKYREMIKTVKMKKLMMNLMKSFHTLNQVLENEQGIYGSMDATACDVSNNPDAENPNE